MGGLTDKKRTPQECFKEYDQAKAMKEVERLATKQLFYRNFDGWPEQSAKFNSVVPVDEIVEEFLRNKDANVIRKTASKCEKKIRKFQKSDLID